MQVFKLSCNGGKDMEQEWQSGMDHADVVMLATNIAKQEIIYIF